VRDAARDGPRAMSASEGKSPADFLKAIKGKAVLVKLNTGVDYRGASNPRRRERSTIDDANARANACVKIERLEATRRERATDGRPERDATRRAGVPGRVHEHSDGADGGARRGRARTAKSEDAKTGTTED